MRDLLIALIVFGLLPVVLYRPAVGIYLWSWIGYMNPHRLSWGFAYSFPFAAIIGIVTIIGFIFYKKPKKLPICPLTIVLIIFIIWMTITTLMSIRSSGVAFGQWDKVMKIQLVIFLTMMIIKSRKELNILIWIIVLSLGFYGIKGGFFTLMTGGNHMVLGPPGTFIEGNTTLALALIMILPLMRYLQLIEPRKWIRIGLIMAMLLTGIAIIGSYSRGALLAGAAIAFFLWLKSPKKALTGVVTAIFILLLLMFMPEHWFAKMDTISTYEQDASAMGRVNTWWFAFNLASDNPIFGGGFNVFTPSLFHRYAPNPNDFHDAHSIYFEIMAEHGFIGLGLFLLLAALAWKLAAKIINRTKNDQSNQWARNLAAMIQVSLVGYLVGGAFLGLAYYDLYYHLLALLVITDHISNITEQESAKDIGSAEKTRVGQRT